MIGITCKCGHTGPHESFTQTLTGELPRGQFQCPACGDAWRVVNDRPAHMTARGFFMPASLKVIGAQAQI